jgi:alkanesulfonate monooxygenase SsuD/methylene tetrahydromethanopterin reductase-like flavin-dependent oxidoreductase (luciferase family)
MHLAVALQASDGRVDAARWVSFVREAASGLLDFVTFADDALDAVVLASRIAPAVAGIGLLPVVGTARTEPFLVSTQIATLDFVSRGRAGWVANVAHFGEAAEHVEVVRRLWDSWEDGAEIRDARHHRFIDVDKVHRIDFEGEHFRVVGPSITPRSPQAQPLVAVDVDGPQAAAFARSHANIAFVRDEPVDGVLSFRDVGVSFDEGESPAALARSLAAEGGNVRLHPASIERDLPLITRELVPELQRLNAFRTAYEASTLRGLLGLARPANRYAAASSRSTWPRTSPA